MDNIGNQVMNNIVLAINTELSQSFAHNDSYQDINFCKYGGCNSHIEHSPSVNIYSSEECRLNEPFFRPVIQ